MLLAMLFVVAALGVGMAALGTVWSTTAKREKEAELLFVGDQFRQAIEGYRQRSPGAVKQYPRSLEDLLEDKRFPMTVRHLRRIWRDPLNGGTEWGLVRDGESGITGVHSLSDGVPVKKAGFPKIYAQFEGQSSYRGWVFAARPEADEAPAESATANEAPKSALGGKWRRPIRGPVPTPPAQPPAVQGGG